jgi:hypothetical protein
MKGSVGNAVDSDDAGHVLALPLDDNGTINVDVSKGETAAGDEHDLHHARIRSCGW